jgi:hypothetical protein
MFKIIGFFIIMLFAQLYVRGRHLIQMWKALTGPHHITKRGRLDP